MKRLLIFSIIFVFVISVGLLYQKPLTTFAYNVIYYSPCDNPIPYSIGSIDSRFNITKDELLKDTQRAAAIWGDTQKKPLFVHDGVSNLTINMVYDSRQALTSKITDLNSDLKAKQGTIDPQITAFKKNQVEFEQKVSSLNSRIQYWNSKGGAPKDEYDKLIAEQKSLQAEAASLNETARTLGQSTDQYNLSAQQLNQTIGDYQTVLLTKPEEGLYEQNGEKRTISIYIDIDKNEFLHTLTHEMGHALGLSHNSDVNSLMYPQTTAMLEPTAADTSELDGICMKRTVFEVGYKKVLEVFNAIQERLANRKI